MCADVQVLNHINHSLVKQSRNLDISAVDYIYIWKHLGSRQAEKGIEA